MSRNTLSVKVTGIRTRPSRAGYILMLIVLAMLTASANYGNNMAFILTFLLISMMLVGLAYSRGALGGLEIANLMPENVFAGERLKMNLELHNTSKKKRYGIWLRHGDPGGGDVSSGPFEVEGCSNTTVYIEIPAPKRGRFVLNHIEIASLYPLGFFLTGGRFSVEKWYLVYPRPEGLRPWPDQEAYDEAGGEGGAMKGGDDFTGVHPHRPGESMRHVDWKAAARGRPLNVKEFTGGGASRLFFQYAGLEGLPQEERLSQLCKWVLEADEQGALFGLGLPALRIGPDVGASHTLKCLEELALFPRRQR